MMEGDEDEDMGFSEVVSQFKPSEGTADAIVSRVRWAFDRVCTPEQQSSRMAKRKAQASSESDSEAQFSTDTEVKPRPPAKKKATTVSLCASLGFYMSVNARKQKKPEADPNAGPSTEEKAKSKVGQTILYTTTRSAIST